MVAFFPYCALSRETMNFPVFCQKFIEAHDCLFKVVGVVFST